MLLFLIRNGYIDSYLTVNCGKKVAFKRTLLILTTHVLAADKFIKIILL